MRAILLLLLLLGCGQSPDASSFPDPTAFDVVVEGGSVVDGTGARPVAVDVGIRGDTIVSIGDLSGAPADSRIVAKGLVVAPGFIDLLGNSQAAVLIDPRLEGKIRQGVTTEVTGEGHSPAPIDDAMAAEMERTKPVGWPAVEWRTLDEFGDTVMQRGTALNFAFYVGATNPREIVLAHQDREPTERELERMVEIVRQARDHGAVGLASALIYPPGRFATTGELIALARESGSYWTHLRSESRAIDAALEEAFTIAHEADVPLNIFHLKIGGRGNWGRMPELVEKIERERAAGLDVAACIYPFTATSTALTSIVPAWALEGGYESFRARLGDPGLRVRIRDALRAGRLAGRGAETILIRGIPSETASEYERLYLHQIAARMGVEPADAALRLFEESRSSPIGIYFSLDEDDMKYALTQPWVAVCSDSGAVVGEMRKSGAHPRAYASFSKILGQYVRDEKLLTLEEAVRKMTSLPASRAGLADRGIIRAGMKADIVIFDPAAVRAVSTYEDPHHFSEGVHHVIVNGVPVLRDREMTGELPGRILRPNRREHESGAR